MTRIKNNILSKKRHKKIISRSKGYKGRNKNCFRISVQKVEKALKYSYIDRRMKKRIFRNIWIQRISAIASRYKLNYSQFIKIIKNFGIIINRKMISEICINSFKNFHNIMKNITKNYIKNKEK